MTATPASLPDLNADLYTTREVGLLLRVTTKTVERWDQDGRLPRDQVIRTPGGRLRVRGDYIRSLLAGDSR